MMNVALPIYTMIALMVILFIFMIIVVVAVIALLIKAIRYSENNNSLKPTKKNQQENTTTQNANTFRYDPYSMDETSSHCPQCNNIVTKDFHYCPKCGMELNTKNNIVKLKGN